METYEHDKLLLELEQNIIRVFNEETELNRFVPIQDDNQIQMSPSNNNITTDKTQYQNTPPLQG